MVFHQKSNVVMYKTGYTGSSGAWIEAVVMLQLLGSQLCPQKIHPRLGVLKTKVGNWPIKSQTQHLEWLKKKNVCCC